MGDLTKNISRHELACKCGCGDDSMDYETINLVQECCDFFAESAGIEKVTLVITSAHRCYKYNRLPAKDFGPGSSDGSQHPRARAIDFKILGVVPNLVYLYLCDKYKGLYGFGQYRYFTHADTRSGKCARW